MSQSDNQEIATPFLSPEDIREQREMAIAAEIKAGNEENDDEVLFHSAT